VAAVTTAAAAAASELYRIVAALNIFRGYNDL